MAITVTKITPAGGTTTTALATGTFSAAAGSTVVAFVATRGTSPTITSVTDSASNTYTPVEYDTSGNGGAAATGAFYSTTITAISSGTVTANLGGLPTSSTLWVFVLDGDLNGVDGFQDSGAAILNPAGTSPTVASATTTDEFSAVLGWVVGNAAAITITPPGAPWTDQSNKSQTNQTTAVVSQTDVGPATYSPAFTFGASQRSTTITIAFGYTPDPDPDPDPVEAEEAWTSGKTAGPGEVSVELALANDLFEDLVGVTWTDITDRVRLDPGLIIRRGAGAEADNADPMTLSLTLDNQDGLFTPGNPNSAYFPGIRRKCPIRVRVRVPANGPTPEVISTRFVGGVDEWPIGFPSGRDNYADLNITATGRWRSLRNARGQLGTIDATVRTFPLVAYWPLDEAPNPGHLTDQVVGTTIVTPGNWTFGDTTEGDRAPGLGSQTRAKPEALSSSMYLPLNGVTPNYRKLYLWGTPHTASNDEISGVACVIARPYEVEGNTQPEVSIGFSGYRVRVIVSDNSFNINAQAFLYNADGTQLSSLLTSPDADVYGGSKVLAVEFYYDGGHRWRVRYGNSIADGSSTLSLSPLPSWFLFKHRAQTELNVVGLSHVVGYVGDPAQVFQGSPLLGDPYTSPARVMQAAIDDRPYLDATEELYAESLPVRLAWLGQIAGYPDGTVFVDGVTNPIIPNAPAAAGAQGIAARNLIDAMHDAGRGFYAVRESRFGNLRAEALQNRHNADPWLALAFDSVRAAIDPTWDDRLLANMVTVTTAEGTGQYLDGVSIASDGVYAKTFDAAAVRDVVTGGVVKPQTIAGWLSNTTDAIRIPQVPVVLNRLSAADLAAYLNDEPCGQRLQLTAAPTQVWPGTIDLTVEGYTETLGRSVWSVLFNTSPRDKYARVFVEGDSVLGRLNLDGQTLNASLNTSATSVAIATEPGKPLLDTSGNDFDIQVDGEVITVTAVSGSSSPQTATLTRSVNGVTASHSSGAVVRLATRPVLAI